MSKILLLNGPLKERIWGSNYFKNSLKITEDDTLFGELWSCSGHQEGNSIIINGEFNGQTLDTVFKEHPELFNYSQYDKFPILVKLIATSDKLSVQVHPNDDYALKNENEFGKTEGWLIVEKGPLSKIVCGHNAKNQQELINFINEDQYDKLLKEVDVEVGDFIPIYPGTIHAIGKDLVIVEIQQSSDVTYRFFDYHRKDKNGMERQLHVKQAIEVTTYNQNDVHIDNIHKLAKNLVWDNEYFTVKKLTVNGTKQIINNTNKAIIATVFDGSLNVENHPLYLGESFIILSETNIVDICGEGIILITEVK